MARPPIPEGFSVHVIRRGINRCDIYGDDDDRSTFLRLLRRSCELHGTEVHAFVLMTTHYHLLATPRDSARLAATMKHVGERYVRYYNHKTSRIGTLWTGRYSAIPIHDERRLLICHRYIEQNPVRARMVTTAPEYAWSSCRAYVHGPRMDWISEHQVYRGLGRTSGERRAAYRAICGIELTTQELWAQRRPPVKPRG